MSAEPILALVARLLAKHRIEAILIGNAAAALQGAPVTTVDLDFLIRKNSTNRAKLKALSADLEATLFRPFYPVSGLVRLMRDRDSLQLDFVTMIHGMRSYEGIRNRSATIDVLGAPLRVASLTDILKSKRAANRPQDLAVLHVLEQTLKEKSGPAAAEPAGDIGRSKKRK